MAKKELHLNIPTEIKYIDTHAHAYPEYYGLDLPAVIERARDKGVAIINVGTHMETSRDCVLTAERFAGMHPHVYSIPGIHPAEATASLKKELERESQPTLEDSIARVRTMIATDLDALGELVGKHLHKKGGRGKVVGIGECGIDLFRMEDRPEGFRQAAFALQKELFRGQIDLALAHDLPLMIHARESYAEILEILDEDFIGDKARLRGNIHFFAGSREEAMMFLDRGFTLSFTGVITFASSYDEVIRAAPIESLMSETDCPYVAPVPHRGKTNEPSFVPYVVEALALAKGIDPEACRLAMLANAERAYGIDLGVADGFSASV